MRCEKCGFTHQQLIGRKKVDGIVLRQWRCDRCRHKQLDPLPRLITPASVLVFDIETFPILTYSWGARMQYIPIEYVFKDWAVISWSAKWLYAPKTMTAILTPKEAKNRDDKRIMIELWDLVNSADVIIGHNVRQFDLKKINWRFKMYNLNPPHYYKIIDTLKGSRGAWNPTSHKLDWLGKYLIGKQKVKTDFDLWQGCDQGNPKSLDQMAKYNRQDVLLVENVYTEMRAWLPSHPNMLLYIDQDDEEACGRCTSKNIKSTGFYFTNCYKYKAWRCLDCGALGRSRVRS